MFVGHYMGGVIHLIMGPPILGRVPSIQNSLSGKVSVAGRGGSKIVLSYQTDLKRCNSKRKFCCKIVDLEF